MPPSGVSLILLLLPAFAAAYVRYSDAYIGKTVACTSEEKFCFRFNLLYNAEIRKCAPMFSHCSENEEVLVVNKEELTGAEPKLKARCGAARCPRHLESYFWPRGECLEPAAADVHCEGSSRTLNMFGEWECWCAPSTNATNATNGTTGAPCPSPVALPQPVEDGRCTVPDLFEPYAYQESATAAGPCTEEEYHCYNHSQVLFQGQCVTPLQRGPCAEGEWVVLVPGPPIKATCAPRRCPDERHVWVDASNLKVQPPCQPKEDIRKLLCPHKQEFIVNAFGNGKCTTSTLPFELPNVRENGVCHFTNTSPDPGTSVDQQTVSFDAQLSASAVPPQEPTSSTPSTLPSELGPGTSTSFPVIGSPAISSPSPVVLNPVASTPIPVVSPSSTFQTVLRPGESTPLPAEVTPTTSTPFPAVASPEVSTPTQIAIIPGNTTPFPVAGSPTSLDSTASVVAPEISQQILVDPLPCVKPPCSNSPAILPPSNVQQVTAPSVPDNDEVSTPTTASGDAVQVNQDRLIAQLVTSQPAAAPVDFRITLKPLSVIIQTPSTDLLAPDVTVSEQQLTAADPVLDSSATLQSQTNLETASFGQVPGVLAAPVQRASVIGNQLVTQQIVQQSQQVPASNPVEQSVSTLGNQVITQQIVEQPQQVPISNPLQQNAPALGNQAITQQFGEQPQQVPAAIPQEQSAPALGNQAFTQQFVEQPQQVSAAIPLEQSAPALGNQAFTQQFVEQPQQVPAANHLEQSAPALGNQAITQQFVEQPQQVPAANPLEQSAPALGNQVITQQFVEQPQQVPPANPLEQSTPALGNQVTTQQIVEQPQQVPASISPQQGVSVTGNQVVTQQIAEQLQHVSPSIPNSQLVTNTGIETFPTIFRVPETPVVPQQNVLLGQRVQSTLPETPAVSQILEGGHGQVHPPLANVPTATITPTNLGPPVHPENVIIPQIAQQNLNSNIPPNTVQIIQNDPSVSSLPHATGLPFVPVQPNNGNVPLVSLQPEQNNYSSDHVQSTPGQRSITPVQTERQGGVVEYVLLRQSNVPVNSL